MKVCIIGNCGHADRVLKAAVKSAAEAKGSVLSAAETKVGSNPVAFEVAGIAPAYEGDPSAAKMAARFAEQGFSVPVFEDWKEMLLTLPLSGKITGILHTADDRVADTIADEGTKILYGRDHFNEEILGLTFKITPFSFFQTNTLSAEVLYRKVQEYARLAGLNRSEGGKSSGMTVYDLYSGTGTIGQIMSTEADKVIGIEIVEEAVAAANENAQTNGLHNCEFLAGDVFRVLDEVDTVPDMIILDPPRDGVGPKALAKIAAYGVENIIYVSCKPTSLARDLAYLMSRGYRPVKICPIDQFPGTVHVESIALLQKMSNTRSKEITLDVDMEDYHRIKNRTEVTADATE